MGFEQVRSHVGKTQLAKPETLSVTTVKKLNVANYHENLEADTSPVKLQIKLQPQSPHLECSLVRPLKQRIQLTHDLTSDP